MEQFTCETGESQWRWFGGVNAHRAHIYAHCTDRIGEGSSIRQMKSVHMPKLVLIE
jgi:hypothetical protein